MPDALMHGGRRFSSRSSQGERSGKHFDEFVEEWYENGADSADRRSE